MVDRDPAEKSKGGDPSRARLRQKFPTIDDLRRRARRRVPRFGFDFVDGGATEEHCIKRNTDAFQEVHLLPHYCVEDKVSTETELFGKRYAAPIGVAPMGSAGLMWPGAEKIFAAEAQKNRIPYILATPGNASIEEIAQIAPDLKDRTLTVSGISKTYAMTGWRIGFAGGPKALIKAMVNMQGQATAGISTVGMAAAVAALNGPQDGARAQSVAYQRRRDIAVEMLNASPGISCHSPEGAFYVFPNVAGCLGKTTAGGRRLNTDEDVCLALLEEHYVATVHGAAYHMSPYLRISTATEDGELVEGLKRIQTFCAGLH